MLCLKFSFLFTVIKTAYKEIIFMANTVVYKVFLCDVDQWLKMSIPCSRDALCMISNLLVELSCKSIFVNIIHSQWS